MSGDSPCSHSRKPLPLAALIPLTFQHNIFFSLTLSYPGQYSAYYPSPERSPEFAQSSSGAVNTGTGGRMTTIKLFPQSFILSHWHLLHLSTSVVRRVLLCHYSTPGTITEVARQHRLSLTMFAPLCRIEAHIRPRFLVEVQGWPISKQ